MQLAVVFAVSRALDEQLRVFALELKVARHRLRELAFGALHTNGPAVDLDVDARGNLDWEFSDSAHGVYQTYATTSPPTRWRLASLAVISPREVVIIAVPMPPSTRGNSSAVTYRRRPDLDTRCSQVITGSRESVYLSLTRIIYASDLRLRPCLPVGRVISIAKSSTYPSSRSSRASSRLKREDGIRTSS